MENIRTILRENNDPTFVNSLLTTTAVQKQKELITLLEHGRDSWFDDPLRNYIAGDRVYIDAIKSAMIASSYHPVMIKNLKDYTSKQWKTLRTVAHHPLIEQDDFYLFFAGQIRLKEKELNEVASRAFDDTTMLLASSFLKQQNDNLYITFSKTTKKYPDDDGFIRAKVIEKWFETCKREWLSSASSYFQEKFPSDRLFELLAIDPNDVL